MRITVYFLLLFIATVTSTAFAGTVYRYKDEQGRWQFSDKKPKHNHEQLELSTHKISVDLPKIAMISEQGSQVLTAVNPWFAPVEFEFFDGDNVVYSWVVEPRSNTAVFEKKEARESIIKRKYSYRFRLGSPIKKSDGQPLRPPIPALGKFKITQGFNGSFSHTEEPNIYAVDIAMKGTDEVHAARDGIVVFVKDDYHMGGKGKFFLDKANLIKVYHSDNTVAIYAHILMGSALVKLGDKVKAGDAIANAGTSGYSTGTHVHFSIQYNNGKSTVSAPFQFSDVKGVGRPETQQWLQVKP